MPASETTDLTLEILKRIQTDLAAQRQDTRAIEQSFIDLARVVQRMDARNSTIEQCIDDTKFDLETMFKMELIGQLAHFEARFEQRFAGQLAEMLDEKLAPVLARLDGLTEK